MAKLKAPLMSLGASGALGKAIVFFGWKGLDCVREYVVPANPKSTAQKLQRGYLGDVVTAIHTAQALDAQPLDEADTKAYALLGSLQPTPRTWFNTICRQWLKQKVATKIPCIWRNGAAIHAVDSLIIKMWNTPESSAVTDGKVWYGTSRTAMIKSEATTPAALEAGFVLDGLETGVKYFVQFKPTDPDTFIGSNSGIYYGVPD